MKIEHVTFECDICGRACEGSKNGLFWMKTSEFTHIYITGTDADHNKIARGDRFKSRSLDLCDKHLRKFAELFDDDEVKSRG